MTAYRTPRLGLRSRVSEGRVMLRCLVFERTTPIITHRVASHWLYP